MSRYHKTQDTQHYQLFTKHHLQWPQNGKVDAIKPHLSKMKSSISFLEDDHISEKQKISQISDFMPQERIASRFQPFFLKKWTYGISEGCLLQWEQIHLSMSLKLSNKKVRSSTKITYSQWNGSQTLEIFHRLIFSKRNQGLPQFNLAVLQNFLSFYVL